MTNPLFLLDVVAEHLEKVVADSASPQTPEVHKMFLPFKTKQTVQSSAFNYIIVRLSKGKDNVDNNTVTVKLLFGTKAEDDEGYADVFNAMEKVRVALLKHRAIGSFRLESYEWEFFDEQPYPEWVGVATTTWTLPTVLDETYNHLL